MKTVLLDRSQFLSLLDLMGTDVVVGLDPEHLSPLEPDERTLVLDDGRSRLLEQDLLMVDEDHYEIEAQLAAMLDVIVQPQAVVRIQRTTSAQQEEFWCWYFVSNNQLVRLIADSPEQFELSQLSGTDSILGQINEILPLELESDEVKYRAIADSEDANLVSILVSDQEEVPALTIMEADGLAPVEAIELYDDLAEPEWRGEIDFKAISSGQVTIHHRFAVLQGAHLSWMAWQDDPFKSELYIQTATASALEEHIQGYLSQVIP